MFPPSPFHLLPCDALALPPALPPRPGALRALLPLADAPAGRLRREFPPALRGAPRAPAPPRRPPRLAAGRQRRRDARDRPPPRGAAPGGRRDLSDDHDQHGLQDGGGALPPADARD